MTSDKAPAPPPFRNPLFDALPTVADARGKQAQFAVRLLVDEIVGKWKIVDGGGARVCDFSDALILAPQRAHLTPVLEALDARGIPHRSDRRGGFLAERECADLRDLLAFLCAPHEDLRLARALKSPLFAVSDSELLAAVQAAQAAPGGKISNPTLWERIKKLTENGGGGEALSRARCLLENWLAQTFASRLPAHDLLSVVFAQGEVEARYAACLPPPQRARGIENLRRFLGFSLSLHRRAAAAACAIFGRRGRAGGRGRRKFFGRRRGAGVDDSQGQRDGGGDRDFARIQFVAGRARAARRSRAWRKSNGRRKRRRRLVF